MPQDRSVTHIPSNDQRNGSDIVRAGQIYNFYLEAEGTGYSLLTGVFSVMRYPGDTPTVTGSLAYTSGLYKGTLSDTDTAALAAVSTGNWVIYVEMTDSDEDIPVPIRIHVAKGWT